MATVPVDKVLALASHDDVRSVMLHHDEELDDVRTQNVCNSLVHRDYLLNDTPYQGAGQVIHFADTGFDKGDKIHPHPAFRGTSICPL